MTSLLGLGACTTDKPGDTPHDQPASAPSAPASTDKSAPDEPGEAAGGSPAEGPEASEPGKTAAPAMGGLPSGVSAGATSGEQAKTSEDIVWALSKATATAAKLPRPKACAQAFDYGAWLSGYFAVASKQDAEGTGKALVKLYRHLDCASMHEFALFHHGLFDEALASRDLFEKPQLDPNEESLVPLVLLLHDMGGRALNPSYGLWLRQHAEPISKSLSGGQLAKLGLVARAGVNLRRVDPSEAALVGKALSEGLSPRCSLSEQLNAGVDPLECVQDCQLLDEVAEHPELTKIPLDSLSASCQALTELDSTLDSPELGEGIGGCIDAYVQATKDADLAVCLRAEYRALTRGKSVEFVPTGVARVSESCELAQDAGGAPGNCTKPTGSKNGQWWLQYQWCIERHVEVLEVGLKNAAAEEDKAELRKQIAEARKEQADAWDTFFELKKEGEGEGGEGEGGEDGEGGQDGGSDGASSRCAVDAHECPDACGPTSYALEVLESCYERTGGKAQLPSAPEPIDPIGPEPDPDSPLGVLVTCLEQSAASVSGKGEGKSCADRLRCIDGRKAQEVDGICTCKGEGSAVTGQRECGQVIQCRPGDSCTCEGAPLDGPPIRNPPAPAPDPASLLSFTTR